MVFDFDPDFGPYPQKPSTVRNIRLSAGNQTNPKPRRLPRTIVSMGSPPGSRRRTDLVGVGKNTGSGLVDRICLPPEHSGARNINSKAAKQLNSKPRKLPEGIASRGITPESRLITDVRKE